MSSAPILHSLDARGVATVTLNRPEVGNAYNGELIEGLMAAMDELSAKPELRVVLLQGQRQALPGRRRLGLGALGRPRLARGERRAPAAPRPRPSTDSTGCPCRRWRWCRAAASAAVLASSPPATW